MDNSQQFIFLVDIFSPLQSMIFDDLSLIFHFFFFRKWNIFYFAALIGYVMYGCLDDVKWRVRAIEGAEGGKAVCRQQEHIENSERRYLP